MAFVILQSYRVRSQYRAAFLEIAPRIVKAGMDLGCVRFEIFEDDDEPCLITEMMVFDSWTHYERLRAIPPTREMEAIFNDLDRFIEGGLDAMQVVRLHSIVG